MYNYSTITVKDLIPISIHCRRIGNEVPTANGRAPTGKTACTEYSYSVVYNRGQVHVPAWHLVRRSIELKRESQQDRSPSARTLRVIPLRVEEALDTYRRSAPADIKVDHLRT